MASGVLRSGWGYRLTVHRALAVRASFTGGVLVFVASLVLGPATEGRVLTPPGASVLELRQQAAGPTPPAAPAPAASPLSAWLGSADVVRVRTRSLPDYPPAALASGSEGVVELAVVVGTKGAVTFARVTKSAPAFDQAVLKTLPAWRLTPEGDEGHPVAALVRLVFEFHVAGGTPTVRASVEDWEQAPLAEAAGLPLPVRSSPANPDLQPPRLAVLADARYPRGAALHKVQGDVLLQVLVLPDGSVGRVAVLKPLDKELDRAALIAARYSLFYPAMLNGQAVPFEVTMVTTFRLLPAKTAP